MVRGIQDAGEVERSLRRLESVLTATGHSAGLTSRQITAFAEEMERSTLATTEGVQEAAAVLATFRSILPRHLHPCSHPGAEHGRGV